MVICGCVIPNAGGSFIVIVKGFFTTTSIDRVVPNWTTAPSSKPFPEMVTREPPSKAAHGGVIVLTTIADHGTVLVTKSVQVTTAGPIRELVVGGPERHFWSSRLHRAARRNPDRANDSERHSTTVLTHRAWRPSRSWRPGRLRVPEWTHCRPRRSSESLERPRFRCSPPASGRGLDPGVEDRYAPSRSPMHQARD